jgi:hypothetical protein
MTVLGDTDELFGLIHMNVQASLAQKVRALAAHRTQFALSADILAITPLWNPMASEYFEPAMLFSSSALPTHHAKRNDLVLGAQPVLTLPA